MSDDIRDNEFEGRPDLIRKRARSIIVTRIAWVVIATYIFVSVTLVGVNAVSSFKTRHSILDCTQQSGHCYQQGQEKTGEVVQSLVDRLTVVAVDTRKIIVLSAACSALPHNIGDEHKIQKCVNRKLEKERKLR